MVFGSIVLDARLQKPMILLPPFHRFFLHDDEFFNFRRMQKHECKIMLLFKILQWSSKTMIEKII